MGCFRPGKTEECVRLDRLKPRGVLYFLKPKVRNLTIWPFDHSPLPQQVTFAPWHICASRKLAWFWIQIRYLWADCAVRPTSQHGFSLMTIVGKGTWWSSTMVLYTGLVSTTPSPKRVFWYLLVALIMCLFHNLRCINSLYNADLFIVKLTRRNSGHSFFYSSANISHSGLAARRELRWPKI